jgi:L-ascorbate metabolism protein UlaG (beta-lactamase superfamily)
MRLKLGRPDLTSYTRRFDVPAAGPSGLAATFLGVASLLLDDGETQVLTDGFFSRPSFRAVALGRISPDRERVAAGLARAGAERVAAVLPVHSHYDHAQDSALVAELTGARLVGGESTANIGRGHGLPAEQIVVAADGETLTFGAFRLTLVESHHCPPDRSPGPITTPLTPPAKVKDYRCGEAWSILVHHESGRSALLQGSAGFVEGALAGRRAEVAYLGVGQLGIQTDDYVAAYWQETVRTMGLRRVVLTHWDDFFRPSDQPLRALPYAVDDLDRSLRLIDRLAAEDGVSVSFPTIWRREDPWAGLSS